MFNLQPENIITAIPVDDEGERIEWMEPESAFACPRCLKRYSFSDSDLDEELGEE